MALLRLAIALLWGLAVALLLRLTVPLLRLAVALLLRLLGRRRLGLRGRPGLLSQVRSVELQADARAASFEVGDVEVAASPTAA
jgi:hypothetical protein